MAQAEAATVRKQVVVDAVQGRAVVPDRGASGGRGVDRGADRPVSNLHRGAPDVRRLPPDRAARAAPRGEAAGLRWCDIDLDGKTAMIAQQLQQYDGRLTMSPRKTAHSTRVIALDHTTVAALAAHRDRQRAPTAWASTAEVRRGAACVPSGPP